jgi:hypothetical protein
MTTAHRGLIGIAGLLWGLQGCFNPAPPAGAICAGDGWCPSGQYCDQVIWRCLPGSPGDAGTPWGPDAFWPWPPFDAGVPDAARGEGIEAALGSLGPVDILIPEVLITYVKPAAGENEPAGFFVQGEPEGPALFVGVDVNLGSARLAAGDRVSFRIGYMDDLYGVPMAQNIADVVLHERGQDTSALLQDVTDVVDVAYSPQLYTSELVRAAFTVDGNMYADGLGFVTAQVWTDVVYGEDWFRVRLPEALEQDVIGLEGGCLLYLAGSPLWRSYDQVLFLVHSMSDLAAVDCPEPYISLITVESGTQLRIELNRALDPASVAPDGSQFTFDDDLQATSAVVSGRFLTLTTTPQNPGQLYTLEVASSVNDVFGKSLPAGNGFVFEGGRSRASVHINELKLNIVPGCDLVELRVVSPGSMAGYDLRSQNTTVLTFGDLQVDTNDLVMVHFDATDASCRRAGSLNETAAPGEQPRSDFPANFDTAYDWYTNYQGPAVAPGVLALRDDQDRIIDAVLVTDSSSQDTTLQTESAAELVVLADEWHTPSGTVPPDGFVDAAFHDNAVPGVDVDEVSVTQGFGALDGARSLQRSRNADNDHAGDWTTAVHSFGAVNAGQSPF